MDVIGVIPARYQSTRFPGKILVDIHGKPLLQWVWERARLSGLLDRLIIACDDSHVERIAKRFGADVIMTAKEHLCGTDRIIEVVADLDVKVIVNIQADEPLIHPSMISSTAQCLLDECSLVMCSLKKKIDNPEDIDNPNVVKVVVDKNDFALYFSRAAIPHSAVNSQETPLYYKHIGLYAYTKDFLFTFKNLLPSKLEKIERLEQLRVLENGYKIKLLETQFDTVGVDTPEDLEKLKVLFKSERV